MAAIIKKNFLREKNGKCLGEKKKTLVAENQWNDFIKFWREKIFVVMAIGGLVKMVLHIRIWRRKPPKDFLDRCGSLFTKPQGMEPFTKYLLPTAICIDFAEQNQCK